MNDPMERLRQRLPGVRGRARARDESTPRGPDAVQVLTAKLLLFTGVGAAAEALARRRATAGREGAGEADAAAGIGGRPVAWGPAVLGTAAAMAHVVHAFAPDERTRLATRTFDLAVVGVGLLSLADALAGARRNGGLPSVGSVSLASAGLLGILIDRTEARHRDERDRLEHRASIVERLVPQRRTRLDRVVVHV